MTVRSSKKPANRSKKSKAKKSVTKKKKTPAKPQPKQVEKLIEDKKIPALTIRLPPEIDKALNRYIRTQTKKERQKKKYLVAILTKFLKEVGMLKS